jgi:hypothetical protein
VLKTQICFTRPQCVKMEIFVLRNVHCLVPQPAVNTLQFPHSLYTGLRHSEVQEELCDFSSHVWNDEQRIQGWPFVLYTYATAYCDYIRRPDTSLAFCIKLNFVCRRTEFQTPAYLSGIKDDRFVITTI